MEEDFKELLKTVLQLRGVNLSKVVSYEEATAAPDNKAALVVRFVRASDPDTKYFEIITYAEVLGRIWQLLKKL